MYHVHLLTIFFICVMLSSIADKVLTNIQVLPTITTLSGCNTGQTDTVITSFEMALVSNQGYLRSNQV